MKIIVGWVDGAYGKPVEMNMTTEKAARELAANASICADSTIELDDGQTITTIKYEDGLEATFESRVKAYDLGRGWFAQLFEDGSLGLNNRNTGSHLPLDKDSVKTLRNLISGTKL